MIYPPSGFQSAGGASQGETEGWSVEQNERGQFAIFRFEQRREGESLFEGGLFHFPACRPNPFPGFVTRRQSISETVPNRLMRR
jgi:hypothetical protein